LNRESKHNTRTGHIDKKLRAPRLGSPGIGHTERPCRIADAGRALVGNAALGIARIELPGRRSKGGMGIGPAGAGVGSLRVVAGMGTAELIHEVGNDAVEVEAVVKAGVRQLDEVAGGNGHLRAVQFCTKGTHGGLKDGDLITARMAGHNELLQCCDPWIVVGVLVVVPLHHKLDYKIFLKLIF
jgi:hypothetical protein